MSSTDKFFSKTVIGHPAALFVLFFTEMWERFSYYGMRAILVIFLTGAILGDNPGWGWSTSAALSLLGTYAMFAYLAPLAGGWLEIKNWLSKCGCYRCIINDIRSCIYGC